MQGAIAQGIGGVLYEHLIYDEQAQLLTASLMDYLIPSSTEIPPLNLRHLSFPSPTTLEGIRGVGEGGTLGPYAAIANAVTDALAPLGLELNDLPITPDRLRAPSTEPTALHNKGTRTGSARRRILGSDPRPAMLEALLYIGSAFWSGATHAATPGHGKTVAAAYLVGARGRVVDAVVLGIVVTLAHTFGIVAFGLLATLGASQLPLQAEGYLSLATSLLIVGIGLWMLRANWGELRAHGGHTHAPDHPEHDHPHEHEHEHRDAWGRHHSHAAPLTADSRPSLGLLISLGLAGGALPVPAGLAVLLAAISTGKLILGLLTVLVFSIGFASVLVVVGLAAARSGQAALERLGAGHWLGRIQLATAVLIVVIGLVLTAGAWRTIGSFR